MTIIFVVCMILEIKEKITNIMKFISFYIHVLLFIVVCIFAVLDIKYVVSCNDINYDFSILMYALQSAVVGYIWLFLSRLLYRNEKFNKINSMLYGAGQAVLGISQFLELLSGTGVVSNSVLGDTIKAVYHIIGCIFNDVANEFNLSNCAFGLIIIIIAIYISVSADGLISSILGVLLKPFVIMLADFKLPFIYSILNIIYFILVGISIKVLGIFGFAENLICLSLVVIVLSCILAVLLALSYFISKPLDLDCEWSSKTKIAFSVITGILLLTVIVYSSLNGKFKSWLEIPISAIPTDYNDIISSIEGQNSPILILFFQMFSIGIFGKIYGRVESVVNSFWLVSKIRMLCLIFVTNIWISPFVLNTCLWIAHDGRTETNNIGISLFTPLEYLIKYFGNNTIESSSFLITILSMFALLWVVILTGAIMIVFSFYILIDFPEFLILMFFCMCVHNIFAGKIGNKYENFILCILVYFVINLLNSTLDVSLVRYKKKSSVESS